MAPRVLPSRVSEPKTDERRHRGRTALGGTLTAHFQRNVVGDLEDRAVVDANGVAQAAAATRQAQEPIADTAIGVAILAGDAVPAKQGRLDHDLVPNHKSGRGRDLGAHLAHDARKLVTQSNGNRFPRQGVSLARERDQGLRVVLVQVGSANANVGWSDFDLQRTALGLLNVVLQADIPGSVVPKGSHRNRWCCDSVCGELMMTAYV